MRNDLNWTHLPDFSTVSFHVGFQGIVRISQQLLPIRCLYRALDDILHSAGIARDV